MAKKVEHISLKKSTVAGKAPTTDVLVDGELAVNIAEGGEKIFLRNTKPEIVEFSSDKLLDKKYLSTTSGGTVNGETTFNKDVKIVYPDSGSTPVSLREVMVDNEMIVAAALNDLNTRVNEQKTDIDSIKTKEYLPLSGGTVNGDTTFEETVKFKHIITSDDGFSIEKVDGITQFGYETREAPNVWTTDGHSKSLDEFFQTSGGTVNGALTVTGNTELKGDVKIVYPDSSSQTVSLREVMLENEKVTSAALNDLNERNDELSAKVTEQKTDIDNLSQKYLPLSGGTMSGDIRYDEQKITSRLNKGATYGISGVTISKLDKVGARNVNTIGNNEIKIALRNERQGLETATTISYKFVNSPKFVKTYATADDILLGDGTTKSVNDFLQISGGTVTGEATFSSGLKFGYPDVSSTPVSLRDVIADNEEVTAAALNDLNDKINKIGDISIANGVLIINDGNTKYKLNLEQLVTGGYATKE